MYLKSTHFLLALFIVLLGLSLLIPARFYKDRMITPPLNAAYRNNALPIERRIDDLLSYMSLEEKVGQMALVEKNSIRQKSDIATFGLGALLSGAGAKPETNTPQGWKEMVEDFLSISTESRLGIPILYGVDATHGHANVPGATVFPHAIGLGASGNPELVQEVARATREEMRATGVNWSFSPNLDLPQDIRWGRTYETFSDDPKLAANLGARYVEGTQNSDGERVVLLSTPKHFIGAGGMEWRTSSNKDYVIDQGTTPVNETLLRETYLPPFKAAVDAGALSIMVGLNSWGDTKLAAERTLITEVLKGELQFQGFAVSDWYGVYEIPGSDYDAAVTAINAGIDMVMLPFDYQPFIRNVVHAVKNGKISEDRINDAVRRILRAKFTLGLFDTQTPPPSLQTIGKAEHRTIARKAVAESMVLLKNVDAVLPITDEVRHIRVAGSAADNVGRQAGAWTVEWQGIDGNWLPGATSILAGIRKGAQERVQVDYDALGNFESTQIADLGIAVVSESPYAEGWGDQEPYLSDEDRETILRLKKTVKKVVVILVSGRPLIITNDLPMWDGAVAAWLPGSEGEGVADVLFGKEPFTGRLPLPWPRSVEQLPITPAGTRTLDEPLFPRYYTW